MATNLVTFNSFIGIQGELPDSTVFGDIKEMVRLDNLMNPEFLNPLFIVKEDTPDTFPFEYQTVRQVKSLTAASGSDMITNPRVTIIFPDVWPDQTTTWLQVGYEVDARTKRSAADWGSFVGTAESNNYRTKLVWDNLVVLELIYKYAIATGRFKVLPNLDTPTATKEQIIDSTYSILELCAAITITMTNMNLGLTKERLRLVTSEFVNISLMKGASFISASDKAFNVYLDGNLGKFGGYPYTTNPFFSQLFTRGQNINDVRTIDFSNVLAFIYNIDNVEQHKKPWVEIGPDGIMYSETDKLKYVMEKTWKTMGLIKPSREHLQYLILRAAPTMVEVNAARTWLSQFQPQLYGSYSTAFTQEQYNAIIANSLIPRYVGQSDVPHDGLPRVKKTLANKSVEVGDKEVKAAVADGKKHQEAIEDITQVNSKVGEREKKKLFNNKKE